MDLKNKNVIITGASSGLGEEIAYQFSKKGANLILLARRIEELNRVKNKCLQYTNSVEVCSIDLSKIEEIEKFIQKVDEIGEIDILINNAGLSEMKYADEFTKDEIEYMFKVNTLNQIFLTTEIVKKMKRNKKGHIISVSSILGKITTPFSSIYSATKFSLIGYYNALRMEVKDYNIKVITINPGFIATNIVEKEKEYASKYKGKFLTVEEVALNIINAINKNKNEVNIPRSLSVISKIRSFIPNVIDNYLYKSFK